MTSPGERGGSAAKPRPASMSSGRHSSEPVRCRMSWSPAWSRRPSNVVGCDPGHDGTGRGLGQRGQGRDAAGEEPLHLGSLDAGHPHDVILPLELVLARLPVVAERAVVARVGAGRGPGRHGRAEALAHPPEVRRHVGQADRDALAGAEDDVGQVGGELLRVRERLAIEGELERVLRPRMPGQLRVQHLVAPGPQRGGPLDPLQEIRDPAPAAARRRRPGRRSRRRPASPPLCAGSPPRSRASAARRTSTTWRPESRSAARKASSCSWPLRRSSSA